MQSRNLVFEFLKEIVDKFDTQVITMSTSSQYLERCCDQIIQDLEITGLVGVLSFVTGLQTISASAHLKERLDRGRAARVAEEIDTNYENYVLYTAIHELTPVLVRVNLAILVCALVLLFIWGNLGYDLRKYFFILRKCSRILKSEVAQKTARLCTQTRAG